MKTVRGIIAQYMVHTTDDIEGLAKEIQAVKTVEELVQLVNGKI